MNSDITTLTQEGEFPLLELKEAVEGICELLNAAVSIIENPHHWQSKTTAAYAASLLDDVPGVTRLLHNLKRMQFELGRVAFTPEMNARLEVEQQAEAVREDALKAVAN